jgi:hypothetical protein
LFSLPSLKDRLLELGKRRFRLNLQEHPYNVTRVI